MGIWRKTLVYLGLVEDDDFDDYAYEDQEHEEEPPPRRSKRSSAQPAQGAPSRRDAVVRAIPSVPQARFHLVNPTLFKADAQEVGDKFRDGYSVLMNMQAAQKTERQRLIDFASGLAYGMGGTLQSVGEGVYLLTPPGVQVSAEERQRFLEERGLFNQA